VTEIQINVPDHPGKQGVGPLKDQQHPRPSQLISQAAFIGAIGPLSLLTDRASLANGSAACQTSSYGTT